MVDVKICDRCGDQFSGWRAVTRKYLLHMDVLRNSTTPSVRHKPVDICPVCNSELKEWYENPDVEVSS
jgi:hypothetical protein